jgi:hypothetical protein
VLFSELQVRVIRQPIRRTGASYILSSTEGGVWQPGGVSLADWLLGILININEKGEIKNE